MSAVLKLICICLLAAVELAFIVTVNSSAADLSLGYAGAGYGLQFHRALR